MDRADCIVVGAGVIGLALARALAQCGRVLTPADHGLRGVFHLLGFDTPGLTACLAVADHIVNTIVSETEESCRVAASAG